VDIYDDSEFGNMKQNKKMNNTKEPHVIVMSHTHSHVTDVGIK
jgi:hypothetical protein